MIADIRFVVSSLHWPVLNKRTGVMVLAAAQIWLTDHLTAKSPCDASKIPEGSKGFSLARHFSTPAVYNFSTEKRSVYCKSPRLL